MRGARVPKGQTGPRRQESLGEEQARSSQVAQATAAMQALSKKGGGTVGHPLTKPNEGTGKKGSWRSCLILLVLGAGQGICDKADATATLVYLRFGMAGWLVGCLVVCLVG